MNILEFVYTIWNAPRLNFKIKKSLNFEKISGKDLVDYYTGIKKNGSYPIKEEVHKFFLCYTFSRIQSKYPEVDLKELFFKVIDFDFIYRPELAYRAGDYKSTLEKRFKTIAKEISKKILTTSASLNVDIVKEFTEVSEVINTLLSDTSLHSEKEEISGPVGMTRHYLIGVCNAYSQGTFLEMIK